MIEADFCYPVYDFCYPVYDFCYLVYDFCYSVYDFCSPVYGFCYPVYDFCYRVYDLFYPIFAILFMVFGFLAPKDIHIIRLSNPLSLSIPNECYSRKPSYTHLIRHHLHCTFLLLALQFSNYS